VTGLDISLWQDWKETERSEVDSFSNVLGTIDSCENAAETGDLIKSVSIALESSEGLQ